MDFYLIKNKLKRINYDDFLKLENGVKVYAYNPTSDYYRIITTDDDRERAHRLLNVEYYIEY